MCRNIRVLFHFQPPTTQDEMRAAALQYVRKVTGTQKPSAQDQAAFAKAIDEVAASTERVLLALHPRGPARTREGEREKARAKWKKREQQLGVR